MYQKKPGVFCGFIKSLGLRTKLDVKSGFVDCPKCVLHMVFAESMVDVISESASIHSSAGWSLLFDSVELFGFHSGDANNQPMNSVPELGH